MISPKMYARVFITELPNNSIHKHFWMMSEADQSRKKGGSFQTWLDEIFQKNPIVFSDPKWMTFNDGRNMTNDPNILVSTLCFGGTMLFCITSGTDYPLFSEYKWITNIGKLQHFSIRFIVTAKTLDFSNILLFWQYGEYY